MQKNTDSGRRALRRDAVRGTLMFVGGQLLSVLVLLWLRGLSKTGWLDTLLLVLAAAGSTVVLSQYSETYVAMLLKAIPLIFVLCWGLVPWVMEGAGLFSGGPTRLTGVPGSEFFLGGIAAALGIGMCGWSCRRQRKRELC